MDIFTKGQSVIKHHLSIYLFIYLFTIHNTLQCLKTRIKNNSRLNKHILLKLSSRNPTDGVSGGACRIPRPWQLALCPWKLILVFLINKKARTVRYTEFFFKAISSILYQKVYNF